MWSVKRRKWLFWKDKIFKPSSPARVDESGQFKRVVKVGNGRFSDPLARGGPLISKADTNRITERKQPEQ